MADTQLESRLKKLKEHLKEENNILEEVVDSFRELDYVAYKLGFLSKYQSYATRISWWPMISVLGLYSAGKSTFINDYLGQKVQRTATQAVDDRFTVICFNGEEEIKTLPGIALNADPRFSFYKISKELEDTSTDNQRVDAYLQLKTSNAEQLRGKILVDSPGFDADSQRSSTLHLTQHILDMSDLVLVFFDARHPEPGAMRDTLEHLVATVIDRADIKKFLFILNQMDITAKEDNPEEVVAAWQRSLAQAGLTAGRFYRIYNSEVSIPIENKQVKQRLDSKCQADLKEINRRMEEVSIQRAYGVISLLEKTGETLEDKIVSQIQDLIQRWKKLTFWTEVTFGIILIAFIVFTIEITIGWNWFTKLDAMTLNIIMGGLLFTTIIFHLKMAKKSANKILKQIQSEITNEYTREGLMRAFKKNTGIFRTLFIWFFNQPAGWSQRQHRRIREVLNSVNNHYVPKLNDRFTNPSGKQQAPVPVETEINKA
jgi:GTPase Era involved in 16S rRNA processing